MRISIATAALALLAPVALNQVGTTGPAVQQAASPASGIPELTQQDPKQDPKKQGATKQDPTKQDPKKQDPKKQGVTKQEPKGQNPKPEPVIIQKRSGPTWMKVTSASMPPC